jgi:hypothetical protein
MAFTARPATDCSTFTGRPAQGPSAAFLGDTNAEVSEAADELLAEWAAADKHTAASRPFLLQGALSCLDELEARKLWPATVAALDDAIEDRLERGLPI